MSVSYTPHQWRWWCSWRPQYLASYSEPLPALHHPLTSRRPRPPPRFAPWEILARRQPIDGSLDGVGQQVWDELLVAAGGSASLSARERGTKDVHVGQLDKHWVLRSITQPLPSDWLQPKTSSTSSTMQILHSAREEQNTSMWGK